MNQSMTEIERHSYDVVVIGAGGAGLRAAIEARMQGKRTAIVCKSLFGKAHTVMAEGGAAAAMGNVNPNDNWQVHFRDTMRGGKFLNHWRMAELHAKEAPDRVWELETYGALFDRTKDGKISQRNFGGHEYPRLAHVGDRTGLEMIRTLQQKIVSLQQDDLREHRDAEAMIKVFAEVTITALLKDGGDRGSRISGAVGYTREDGTLRGVRGSCGDPGHRRHRQVVQGDLQLVGVHRRRARPRDEGRRDAAQHGVRPVPPDRHGLAAQRQGHPGHRVGAWRRRRPEELRRQALHVRLRPGRLPQAVRRDRGGGRRAGTRTRPTTAARRSCSPATRLPGRSTPRSKPAAAPRPAASSSTSRRGCPPRRSARSCPSMYHQFKELADVDITAEPMEVGPTCHYVMGGVEVDPDTAAAVVPGLFAAGEVSGGMHGSNRLGGNSLSDLLVFGRRAGAGAATYVDVARAGPADGDRRRRRGGPPRGRSALLR